MKIAPVQVPTDTLAPTLHAPSPLTSFEDILTASELKDEERQRAFGFSELSIFGPDGATAHRAVGTHGGPPATPDREAMAVGGREPPSPAILGTPSLQAPAPLGARNADARLSLRMALQQSQPTPQVAAFTGPRQSSPPPETGRASASGAAVFRQAQPQPRSTTVSLTFAEHNGTVQLLAAAGGLAPDARSALRRAAIGVLAEFGLALGDITLDGQPVEPLTIRQTGAFDGDHFG